MPARTDVKPFLQPADPDVKVWRYMDMYKLLNIIVEKRLFLSSVRNFKDKWEGTLTVRNKEMLEEQYKLHYPFTLDDEAKRSLQPFVGDGAKNVNVSCWHMNEYESAAMWDLYGGATTAVSLQTTYARLVKYFPGAIIAGGISYIDYQKDCFSVENNLLSPVAHKRRSFEHEREVRFVYVNSSAGNSYGIANCAGGATIHFDINEVVENIFIAPNADDWIETTIRETCRLLNVNVKVVKSELYSTNVL